MFIKKEMSTTQIIAFGFLAAIMLGTAFLILPISAANGQPTSFMDALFTATSSTCVTGFTTVNTLQHWSGFGKAVILILIQFGGLGVITFATTIFLIMRRKITLKERLLIQDAYNLDTLQGLVKLTIHVMKGTFIAEVTGAIIYCSVLIPEFGYRDGIIHSVFLSVSAFCNAGMDLFGDTSLSPYRNDIIMNLNTIGLIILGGLGFPVWIDLSKKLKKGIKQTLHIKKIVQSFNLHTKLVLAITIILIIGGTAAYLILEWNNPKTIETLPWWEKIMVCLFQSVTTRTAGFYTVDQSELSNASAIVSMLLMFIGGSPSGTAGGVKTVTIGMMVIAVISIVKGKKDTEVFHRRITESSVKKGMAVVLTSMALLILTIIGLAAAETGSLRRIVYESVSAISTAGMSLNFTPSLSAAGKCIIILAMYLGRLGPITLALFFNTKHEKRRDRTLPTEKIIVG